MSSKAPSTSRRTCTVPDTVSSTVTPSYPGAASSNRCPSASKLRAANDNPRSVIRFTESVKDAVFDEYSASSTPSCSSSHVFASPSNSLRSITPCPVDCRSHPANASGDSKSSAYNVFVACAHPAEHPYTTTHAMAVSHPRLGGRRLGPVILPPPSWTLPNIGKEENMRRQTRQAKIGLRLPPRPAKSEVRSQKSESEVRNQKSVRPPIVRRT